MKEFSFEQYWKSLSPEQKLFINHLAAQLNHKEKKELDPTTDWGGKVFWDYIYGTRGNNEKQSFRDGISKYTTCSYATVHDIHKQGLGEKNTKIAFCFAAYIQEHFLETPFEKFLLEFYKYTQKRSSHLNIDVLEDVFEESRSKKSQKPTYKTGKSRKRYALENSHCDTLNTLITQPEYTDAFPVIRTINKDKSADNECEEPVSLSPLNHKSVPLEGRGEENTKLNEFLNSTLPFQMLFVIAPSGAGKTRLVTEWYRGNSDLENWQAGFLENDESLRAWKKWEALDFQANTLIVVDYIYRFKEIVSCITKKGAIHSQENEFKLDLGENSSTPKLRLLILDHTFTEADEYNELDFNQKLAVGKSSRLGYAHKHSPIYLSQQGSKEHEAMIKSIIASTSKKEIKSDLVNLAFNTLIEMETFSDSFSDNKIAFANFPLFAILIGEKLRHVESASDIDKLTQWNRRDLIDFYFQSDKKYRIPWQADRNLGDIVGAAVSAATAIQDIRYKDIFEFLSSYKNKEWKQRSWNKDIEDEIKATCNHIVSTNDALILKRYQPDIIGETFFLNFLVFFLRNKEVLKILFSLISYEDIKLKRTRKYQLPVVYKRFFEFISRITLNLSNDDINSEEIRNYWDAFIEFLSPKNFAMRQNIRLMLSIANVEIVQILRDKQKISPEFIAIIDQLSRNVEYKKVATKLIQLLKLGNHKIDKGGALEKLLFTITRLADWLISQNGLSSEFEKILIEVLEEYEAFTGISGSKIFIPCMNDTQHLFEYILNLNKKKKLEIQDSNHRTPFLLACENGCHNVIDILLKERVDTAAVVEDSWNGLMLASLNGHKLVVEKLLDIQNIKSTQSRIALILACQNSYEDLLEKLLELEVVDINEPDENGITALMTACSREHENIVRRLLEFDGIMINKADRKELKTALMIACHTGNEVIVKMLLDTPNIDIHQPDKNGDTALIYACRERRFRVVGLMMRTKKVSTFKAYDKWEEATSIAMESKRDERTLAALHGKVIMEGGC